MTPSAAKRANAHIRKLHRELKSLRTFAEKVRDTSTCSRLRTHADILLSTKRLEKA